MKSVIMLLKGNVNYDARVQKFIRSLVKRGFRVKLITWSWEPSSYSQEGLEIVDLVINNRKLPGNVLKMLWCNIGFCLAAARKIKESRPGYCHFNDLNTFITVYFLKKWKSVKYIYDAHELFPEKQMKKSNRLIWGILERFAIKRADHIIVPEKNRAEYLRRKYGLDKVPLVINNFPEYTKIDREKGLREKKRLGFEDKKVIIYQGLISSKRYIEDMIEALKYLAEAYILVLIGFSLGSYEKEMKDMAERYGLGKRVFMYGKVRPADMLQTLCIGDIAMAFYDNKDINSYLCAPNKIFDYIMAGLKVIANSTPALDIIDDIKGVKLIKEVSGKSIARAVTELTDEREGIKVEDRGRFTWEKLSDKIESVYSE
ncbi:MAG: glycosyltransferase [Elusimicrobia bacterium]|nr:glycosyltransferase [Elusimicrobiota bacterium]